MQNLTELYNHLPLDSTYRSVAKGILENLDKLRYDFTIYDIAELTNSSRTTVWRMVQKMDYQNFTDFRHALKTATTQYSYYNRMLPGAPQPDAKKVLDMVKGQILNASELFSEKCTSERLETIAETDVLSCLTAMEGLFLAISEYYRAVYMEK